MKPETGKKQDQRRAILTEIKSAAKLYKRYLVGHKFLYVFDGRFIEVLYKAQNFKHLTGVETSLPAKRFYSSAVNDTLQTAQIGFNKAHPYELCLRKVKHLHQLVNLASSESFMLEEIGTKTQTYKFGTTDLNFTLCMNRELDENGNEINECYIVQSLRDEDCFDKAQNVYEVTHIFSKPNDAKYYTDIVYLANGTKSANLPESIARLVKIPDATTTK